MTEEKLRSADQGDPRHRVGGASERAWTWAAIGLAFVLGTGSLVWLGPGRPPGGAIGRHDVPGTPSQVTPAMVPLVTGEEPLEQIFTKAGCAVCHTIPGIRGAEGRVGPVLILGETGAERLRDPAYRGGANTVREYIVESVLDPGRYIVPGYPPLAMPRWYGQKLSAAALDKIASYLEQQRDASGPNGRASDS